MWSCGPIMRNFNTLNFFTKPSDIFGPYFLIIGKNDISLESVFVFGCFIVICYLNLLLAVVSEYHTRRDSERASLARLVSLQTLIYLFAGICLGVCTVLFLMLGMMFELMPIIILIGMLMLTMILFLNCRWLVVKPALFYCLKEAIFFFPIIGVFG